MRKNLEKRIPQTEKELAGHGIVIDVLDGFIYRLAVAPCGESRVCKNRFNVRENTVIGYPVKIWDFKDPERAIAMFEEIKIIPGMTWREDDRVLYQPEE